MIVDMILENHYNAIIKAGYQPVYLALAGSQNYDLDYENSDIDTKCIVLPDLHQLVFKSNPISKTLLLDNNEQCDIKDARIMFSNFKKQNINFLEILFSDYYYIDRKFLNEFYDLRDLAEDIAHIDPERAVYCMCGMAYNKLTALEKITPTSKIKIEQYGYDSKQLHHIVRLREFLERYIANENVKDCLRTQHRDYLLKIKRNEFSLDEARKIGQTELEKMFSIQEKYHSNKKGIETIAQMDEILYTLFEKSLHIQK